MLATVCLVLSATVTAEITRSAPSYDDAGPAGSIPRSPSHQDEVAPEFSLLPLSSFSEITQRPLFSETRRPARAADLSGEAWSSFSLKGVIVAPFTREALVLHDEPVALVSLREGETLDGWMAESILPDRVVFRNGTERQELKLVVAKTAAQPAVDITSPPPPPARPQPPSFGD